MPSSPAPSTTATRHGLKRLSLNPAQPIIIPNSPTISPLSTSKPSFASKPSVRRVSSISYNAAEHPKPSPARELSFQDFGGAGGGRAEGASASEEVPRSTRSGSVILLSAPPTRKSTASTKDTETRAHTPVLTLAERHADLLHFIAQKESKCLELRTQLAQHEADLLTLKKKWERIVSRAGTTTTADVPTTPGSGLPRGEMVDALKEGVTGLGRMFSGLSIDTLGSSSASPAPSGSKHKTSPPPQETVFSPTQQQQRQQHAPFQKKHAGSPLSRSSSLSSVVTSSSLRNSISSNTSMSTVASFLDDDECVSPVASSEARGRQHQHHATLSTSSVNGSGQNGMSPTTWVPGLNKKWEELQRTEVFSKSSKRASTLLSAVTSDLFNSLAMASPPPSSSSSPSQSQAPSAASSSPKCAMPPPSYFAPPLSSLSSPSTSLDSDNHNLLDADLDADRSGLLGMCLQPSSTSIRTPVLQPLSLAPLPRTSTPVVEAQVQVQEKGSDSDEEWNWS
ncbi:hypothetical protein BOTBODRAFT_58224 [Botryobasidium botryosum FD-172 SS1]|uniref:Uncharacterized protein n=1 Tax=Botryobasidium botryosum (strain FD-172 SS1) TaxID=930990 RepID=A0A067M3L4_BOTB1|nr:hypothetical protein BOTBODRAFT_58224 [Botryobasidium botryosum FD-172 SS1]